MVSVPICMVINQMQTIEVKINNMSCKACSDKVEKALNKLKGVHLARVNLEEDLAKISFDPKIITKEEIENTIENTGYSVKGKESKSETKKTILQGILYGLIPHIGCIGFIIASILGITFAAELFAPLLANPLFFYGLIGLSIVFATISSAIFLKQNNLLSVKGIKKKIGYLTVMYATTIGVSLLFLFVIFPMLVTSIPANLDAQTTQNLGAGTSNGANSILTTQNTLTQTIETQTITLKVQIPCAGHTPYITGEFKKISGVTLVKSTAWDTFKVTFDPAKTTKEKILSAEVFKNYPAKVIN